MIFTTLIPIILSIAMMALILVSMWKIFEKMDCPGWHSLIPVYNQYVMFDKANFKSGFFVTLVGYVVAILSFIIKFFTINSGMSFTTLMRINTITGIISLAALIIVFIVCLAFTSKFSHAFGHGMGMTLLMLFLPMIAFPIIGFGASTYSYAKKENIDFEGVTTPENYDDFYADDYSEQTGKRKKSESRYATPEELAHLSNEKKAFVRMIETALDQVEANDLMKPEKKRNVFSQLNESLKNVSISNLSKKINGYGLEYSGEEYLKRVLIVMIGMVIGSMFFQLKWWATILLLLIAALTLPSITAAQFKQIADNETFEQIVTYLDQMIIAFKNQPKILMALRATVDMTEGRMQELVKEAIEVIETDTKSEVVYKRALALIEAEYKCSRIRTLHKFMLTVEKENSVNYQDSMDTLYLDVQDWKTRAYKFQASLADTKNKITILLGGSVGIAAVFAYILTTVETSSASKITKAQYDAIIEAGKASTVFIKNGEFYQKLVDIIGTGVYQWATIVFFVFCILFYAFVNSKINGNWLVMDLENPKDKEVLKNMRFIALIDPEKDKSNTAVIAIIGAVLIGISLILKLLHFENWKMVFIASLIITVLFMATKKTSRNSKIKMIKKNIRIEFPLWMRDISLNLHNRVVVRSINESAEDAPYILKPFIWRFLSSTERDPASIVPYIDFLDPYGDQELTTTVKTLYSIRSLSPEDGQRQVTDLVERNQDILADAERMRHEDSIAGTSMLSLLPMVAMSFLLMIYMVVMLFSFMALVSGAA